MADPEVRREANRFAVTALNCVDDDLRGVTRRLADYRELAREGSPTAVVALSEVWDRLRELRTAVRELAKEVREDDAED